MVAIVEASAFLGLDVRVVDASHAAVLEQGRHSAFPVCSCCSPGGWLVWASMAKHTNHSVTAGWNVSHIAVFAVPAATYALGDNRKRGIQLKSATVAHPPGNICQGPPVQA